jgi:hypothetical protein
MSPNRTNNLYRFFAGLTEYAFQTRIGVADRQAFRHIGDFTLFWTGIYPEALERIQKPARKDFFIDYCQQGKRSYLIASTIHSGANDEEAEVLERLSHDFELCVYGLGEVRREWERREPDATAGPIVLD